MLDYGKEKRFLRDSREYVGLLRRALEEGKRVQREKERLQRKLDLVNSTLQSLEVLRTVNKDLHTKALSEDFEFKNRRLDYVSDRVNEFVNKLFPERGFTVKVTCDFHRGMRAKLRLYDKYGNERLLHISEGRFLQSLISFSSSVSILESLGANKLYLDEVFAVSDPENLVEVSILFRKLIERLSQIFMIEQTSVGYKDLPRREIHLEFDSIAETASVSHYVDYD